MSTREWAYSMIDELPDEEFHALMVIVQSMRKHSEEAAGRSTKPKSARGILHQYANPSLIPLEEGIWEQAAAEKYLSQMEESRRENS